MATPILVKALTQWEKVLRTTSQNLANDELTDDEKDILSELLTKEIGKTNKELKNAIEEVNK